MSLTDNQTKILHALRNTPESVRLQGQAFREGKMCACVVAVNAVYPGRIDISGNSISQHGLAMNVYDYVTEVLGRDWRKVATWNDELAAEDEITVTPKYTFAEVADKLEERWTSTPYGI